MKSSELRGESLLAPERTMSGWGSFYRGHDHDDSPRPIRSSDLGGGVGGGGGAYLALRHTARDTPAEKLSAMNGSGGSSASRGMYWTCASSLFVKQLVSGLLHVQTRGWMASQWRDHPARIGADLAPPGSWLLGDLSAGSAQGCQSRSRGAALYQLDITVNPSTSASNSFLCSTVRPSTWHRCRLPCRLRRSTFAHFSIHPAS